MLASALGLVLTQCAPSLDAFNERGGVIRHTRLGTNLDGVLAMADRYCQQFGRHARITDEDLFWSDTVNFDCVEP